MLVVPLLAVSSSGESTRLGSRAATAGRNGVATTAVRAARVKMTAGGASFQMSTALTAMMEPRVTSQPIMIILREYRSASVAVNGLAIAMRASRTVPNTPTAVTPPIPYAHTAMAVA